MRQGVILVIIIVLGIIAIFPINVFYIKSSEGSIFKKILRPGEIFALEYIHSWDKTPVRDVFTINKDNNLVLLAEEYQWMGAGLDYHPREEFEFDEDTVRILKNKEIEELNLAVGSVSKQHLCFGNEKIPLAHLQPPGSKIILKSKKTNLIKFLLELMRLTRE